MDALENKITLDIPEDQQWENLKISNDFIFAKVMRNPKLCKGILERLLEIAVDSIGYPEEQKVIDITKDSKSVRLDVYLLDEKGTVYNIEIQTTENRNLPKRTRYYQGMIDLNSIEKGIDYQELPQSYVIFICTFDPFGKQRWKYTFENKSAEDSVTGLEDGTAKIFFNTKGLTGGIGKDAQNILTYIENNSVSDRFTESIAQEVQKIKENREWRVEYMTLLMKEQEKYREGMKRGMAEGMEKGMAEGMEKGMAEGRKRGIIEGEAKGIISTLLNLGYGNDAILAQLRTKPGMEGSQAENYLKRYYEGSL